METQGINNVDPMSNAIDKYFAKMQDTIEQGINAIERNMTDKERELLKDITKDALSAAEEAIKQLNEMMKNMQKDLRFHLFVDGTDLAYVEVINPRTKQVIKQVPPEQLIEALLRIHNAIGLILDKYL